MGGVPGKTIGIRYRYRYKVSGKIGIGIMYRVK